MSRRMIIGASAVIFGLAAAGSAPRQPAVPAAPSGPQPP